jgi:hypothetical protein
MCAEIIRFEKEKLGNTYDRKNIGRWQLEIGN